MEVINSWSVAEATGSQPKTLHNVGDTVVQWMMLRLSEGCWSSWSLLSHKHHDRVGTKTIFNKETYINNKNHLND